MLRVRHRGHVTPRGARLDAIARLLAMAVKATLGKIAQLNFPRPCTTTRCARICASEIRHRMNLPQREAAWKLSEIRHRPTFPRPHPRRRRGPARRTGSNLQARQYFAEAITRFVDPITRFVVSAPVESALYTRRPAGIARQLMAVTPQLTR